MGDLDDYRWLIGVEAARLLGELAHDDQPLHRRTSTLRRQLSAARTHLLLQQVELRRRAREKFRHAARMYFTPRGLEQATDDAIAAYKAARFQRGALVADLCCGIGGDLCGLTGRGPVRGVDRSAELAVLAEANLAAVATTNQPIGNRVQVGEADSKCVADTAAWHIDPDRRPQGRRTTRVELHDPPASMLERLLAQNGNAAIKLAPAVELPAAWRDRAESEWIGRGGECRQLVAWFGELAREPGRRRATLLDSDGEVARTFSGDADVIAPRTTHVDRYVCEPHAAGLAGALAAQHDLGSLTPRDSYLTSDRPPQDAALAVFEVVEVDRLDVKRLRRWLADRGIGRLEIKKRGVSIEPDTLRRQLRPQGDAAATLLLANIDGAARAILASRVP
jgi:hypothetical protein